MATNSSEHLGLHLWEPTDQVLRTEFNQNWTKIDTAVAEVQETAEEKPYVIGSYTGNGGTQSINLGFKPRFLLITGTGNGYMSVVEGWGYTASTGGAQATQTVQLADTGFTVTFVAHILPLLNTSDRTYTYIAFR